MFISIDRGYGRHILDLTEQQTVGAVEAEVIGQFFAIASFPSGKASIAFLLHRIFPGRKLAWFLWTVVGANAVCFYVDAILILAQCQPVAFQWDHSIPGGSCWSSKVVIDWGFLTGGMLWFELVSVTSPAQSNHCFLFLSHRRCYRLCLRPPSLVLHSITTDGRQREAQCRRCPEHGLICGRLLYSENLLHLNAGCPR